mmetsp:Transcript_45907/g.90449  ORF Transcript_45907/g.90449 Transcript_45907/m.90449 type:complete len:102 (-) Transcript_45907:947-1252(-)
MSVSKAADPFAAVMGAPVHRARSTVTVYSASPTPSKQVTLLSPLVAETDQAEAPAPTPSPRQGGGPAQSPRQGTHPGRRRGARAPRVVNMLDIALNQYENN